MWGELANFGSWWLSPVGFLLAYAALGLVSAGRRGIPQIPGLARTSGLVLVGMAAGFHHVYVFSPYDITWHVQSSFTRLVFQFWPIAIVCLLAIGSRSSPGARWTRSTRISTAAAAAAAVGTIALLAARGTLAPAPVPTLEINRTEVVRGADAYTLRIRGMERGIVEVGYRIDGGEEQFMTVRLDESGEIEFDVSDQTPPGTYTFTGVRDTATGAAYEVTGSITVR
jgi:hypothetical protein